MAIYYASTLYLFWSSFPFSYYRSVAQIRWIVWTFAALERKFPHKYLGILLTKTNVMAAVFRRVQSYVAGTVHPKLYRIWKSKKSADVLIENRADSNIPEVPVPCPRFGKRKGTMSPLQRVADICVLGWPMAVCVSIDPSETSRYRNSLGPGPSTPTSGQRASQEQNRSPLVINVMLHKLMFAVSSYYY